MPVGVRFQPSLREWLQQRKAEEQPRLAPARQRDARTVE
jgi:hypothetical protein